MKTKCPFCDYETDNPFAYEEHVDCHDDPQEDLNPEPPTPAIDEREQILEGLFHAANTQGMNEQYAPEKVILKYKALLDQFYAEEMLRSLPKKMSEDEINTANTIYNQPPKDMAEGFTHKDALNMSKGYNFALEDTKKAIKDWLGGSSNE